MNCGNYAQKPRISPLSPTPRRRWSILQVSGKTGAGRRPRARERETEMANVTAFVGRDFGVGEWGTDDVIAVAIAKLNELGIEYATFAECIGCWRDGFERSVRIDLLECDAQAAGKAFEAVAADLMQWEVIYTVDGAETLHVRNDPTEARAAWAAGAVKTA